MNLVSPFETRLLPCLGTPPSKYIPPSSRVPLFFYILHFWTFSFVAAVMYLCGLYGLPLPWVVPVWLFLLLSFLRFICQRYYRFKSQTALDSWWRLL